MYSWNDRSITFAALWQSRMGNSSAAPQNDQSGSRVSPSHEASEDKQARDDTRSTGRLIFSGRI